MGKLEFLAALRRAMTGLAPEVQAKTLAYYEQRFIDGLTVGRGEEEIAGELGDPKKIAMTLRASSHLSAFQQKKNPATLLRMLVSGLGLLIFNLFMVVPAAVYASLLAALYACALALYVGGIAVTAGGLAGASELVLGGPLSGIVINAGDDSAAEQGQTRVSIGENGITVERDKTSAGAGSPSRVRRAEAAAERGIRISTELGAESRTTQALLGLAMVVGGIIAFLLSLVVTKYTIVGIKRYIEMNFALLKGS